MARMYVKEPSSKLLDEIQKLLGTDFKYVTKAVVTLQAGQLPLIEVTSFTPSIKSPDASTTQRFKVELLSDETDLPVAPTPGESQ